MQLITDCHEADFMQNWRESKERLQIDVPTMISEEDQDKANISGKSFGCEPLLYFIAELRN